MTIEEYRRYNRMEHCLAVIYAWAKTDADRIDAELNKSTHEPSEFMGTKAVKDAFRLIADKAEEALKP